MPLLTPNHRCKTCGHHEALNSTTIVKICGVKTSSAGQERYILKSHLEFHYQCLLMKCQLALCLTGTIDAVFILRRLQEEYHAKGKKLYVFCGPRESFRQSTKESVEMVLGSRLRKKV